ncbi:MAG TPA: sulfatase-like hydrolase/transferase, partial [Burkholderiales bacterium]|nr:sulfatase-like hydrolase/transferase [Burkholderiales bacterium]
MSSEAGRPRRPASRAGALALLALTFPGLFLPLDVIYAGPGISAFATPDQAARIFLYSVGVSLLLSLVACAACGIWWKRGAEAALLFSLTLIAFAILNGVVVWSAYYVAYSSSLLWLRRLLTFGVSVLAAVVLAPQLRAQDHATLRTLLGGSTTIVALGALACAMFLAFHRVPEARAVSDVRGSANRPSIFLITVDTLSALHLPMYGYARDTTPNLADFASHANLFLRNYADSNFTTPSITSILYGVRPWTHRAIQLEARPLRPLASESLPAELQAAGYFTASVATNPWAAPRHLGIEDRFAALSERRICGAANPIYLLPADLQVAIGRSLLGGVVAESVMRTANALGVCPEGHFDPEIALSEARRILAAAPAGKPVFLWIHLYPPHDPYLAPEPFAGTFDSSDTNRTRASTIPPYLFEAGEHFDFPGALPARYDEAVRYVDHHIGGFLEYLKKMNRYDASIIVVSADHGESFTHRYGNHSGPK